MESCEVCCQPGGHSGVTERKTFDVEYGSLAELNGDLVKTYRPRGWETVRCSRTHWHLRALAYGTLLAADGMTRECASATRFGTKAEAVKARRQAERQLEWRDRDPDERYRKRSRGAPMKPMVVRSPERPT